ncbi:hypothetical protein HN51_038955 [Arachis hypogaea]|uniref:Protein kinase domain-containing protein n=1 Tax=Arachis hypogaea TaxID=3818 RepID=A0A444YH99_ARAHY|nr:protein STRUBBELIG-RECEPTOR FAMILY 2-like [Arachis ipaensis]XP_025663672.1 protein STRUBBELIG-RECEPTOR FAMILY 2 [Arachis hypogaea]QHN84404.1 Protein STRUBBELIG-RECEPTOR FAMILY [Arachis hypogaea]RYR01296.1 hypothetical protein Ahy_B06g080161 [Arachis hypogaea]
MICDYLYVQLNLVVFSSILISQGLASTPSPEVSALQDLYKALNYPPQLQGWNGSDPCEESWKGIACSGSSVIHIKIRGLNLTGNFGSMLRDLQNLKELDVSSNNIGGEIPFSLPRNARNMNLSHNLLNGPIGDVFTGLDDLKEMDLSYNNFSGDLPRSFGSLKNLDKLFLQNNRFTGSVTYLAELPLSYLNIQDNLFSGILPLHFHTIPNLRIGGNNFHSEGSSPPWPFPLDTVPIAVERNFSHPPSHPVVHNFSHPPIHPVEHNTTVASAIRNYAPPPPKVSQHKEKHMGPGGIAFMVGAGTLMATGVALFVAIRLSKRRAHMPSSKSLESNHFSLHSHPSSATIEVSSTALDESPQIPAFDPASLRGPMGLPPVHHNNIADASRRSFSRRSRSTGRTKVYTVSELQFATNNFNECNVLGEGSLGTVYRAKFPDGKILAVKSINLAGVSYREEEKFLDVICTASRLKHPNIVALNGYCLERGKHLLVYDYVRNLTLHDALHRDVYKPLSWILRLRIAVGVANALDYLHSAFSPPVAHGNLKAANVLLDENLMPRLSDCGLAALRPLRSIQATEAPIDVGYLSPDHGRAGGSSRKKDVYAFGVLLLEMLTGRKAFDGGRPIEEQYLVKWASPRLHDNASLEQMVDPGMKRTFSSKALSRYAAIVSLCIQPSRHFRPQMSEVVDSLVSFSQKFNIAKGGGRVGADGGNFIELESFEKSFRSTNSRFMGSPALSHVSA